MYQIKIEKLWRNVVGLLVCFCILLVSADCMAQHGGIPPVISSGQNDTANLTIPFELPEQLCEGSYLEFPNSFTKKDFRYSREGVIWVYFYKTKELAKKDMKLYAEKNYKISKEESSVLAEHFGCIQKTEVPLITAWFTMDSYIIGIMVPKNKMERKKLVKTGEEIILNYNERINRMFSTPEKCFTTYLKAVDARNTDLIIECMYNDGSEKAKSSLIYLKAMIPYLSMAMMSQSAQEKKEDIKFGKAEIISDSEAKLLITNNAKITQSSSACMLLYIGGYRRSGDAWIPFRKGNGKWGIDYAKLQERTFNRARGSARKAVCMSNLKQIGLALHMYAQDYDEKFPDDISALCPNYIANAKIFKCPSDKTISEIKEMKPGTRISYVYIKGLTEKDSQDSMIAYDASPDNHDGEGRNVLFLDGHVKWYDEKEFQKLLSKN